MTVKELYEFAKEKDLVDSPICVELSEGYCWDIGALRKETILNDGLDGSDVDYLYIELAEAPDDIS